ncbi:unnamed protein product [Lupinus luteus]|uniref:Uncharacterized protein n=1 Tax=Lupinus luteus TaxID=3873 RepID=A0AAV1XQ10_LUPLU
MYRVCMAAIVAIAQGHVDPSHKWKTAFDPIHQNMAPLFSVKGLLNLTPDLAGAVTDNSSGVENIQRQVGDCGGCGGDEGGGEMAKVVAEAVGWVEDGGWIG